MANTTPQPRFIKPFSKGQITLPKDYRDFLGIDENSWLKISLWNKKQMILQPIKEIEESMVIKPKVDLKTYREKLLKIKGKWFDVSDFKKIRKEIEKRLAKNERDLA